MLDLNGESTVAKVGLETRSLRCLQDWMVGSRGMPDLSGEIDLAAIERCGIMSWEE